MSKINFKDFFKNIFKKKPEMSKERIENKKEFEELEKEVRNLGNIFEEKSNAKKPKKELFDFINGIKSRILQKFERKKKIRKGALRKLRTRAKSVLKIKRKNKAEKNVKKEPRKNF